MTHTASKVAHATTPTAHSKIGASSMYRWSECPASVRLSANIPARQSVYADEGTYAHDIAANLLLGKPIPNDVPGEVMEAVEVYVNEVTSIKKKSKKSVVLIEHKFDLTRIHDGLFGTGDCVIYVPDEAKLYVIDYKHGAGIPVDVVDEHGKANPQLMYYGLGALLSTDFLVKTIELIIVQPRCFHPGGPVRRHAFPSIEIFDFAAELKRYAELTEDPNAEMKSGDHCKFCPVKPTCPLLHKQANEVAAQEFSPVTTFTPEKLTKTLAMLDPLEEWIKAVREFAYSEAQQGRPPIGFKLVQKQARRKFVDEEGAVAMAQMTDRTDLLRTSMKTITDLEKQLGKKKFETLLGPYVASESSGTVLVPVSDKRPEVKNDAALDFKPITD